MLGQAFKQTACVCVCTQDALEAQKRALVGELASAVSAVVEHVFAPDILQDRIEVASTVLVRQTHIHTHTYKAHTQTLMTAG